MMDQTSDIRAGDNKLKQVEGRDIELVIAAALGGVGNGFALTVECGAGIRAVAGIAVDALASMGPRLLGLRLLVIAVGDGPSLVGNDGADVG